MRTGRPARFGDDVEAHAVDRARWDPLQAVAGAAWASAVGWEELERPGLLDTSGCCGLCHATLPDGPVCCAGKRRLLQRMGL